MKSKWNIIGRLCLILSCGLLFLFSTVAYGADYDYTYKYINVTNPYSKGGKEVRVVYNNSTYRNDLIYKNKSGKTITVRSVRNVFTNGKKIYYCKGITNASIECYSYSNDSTKEILKGVCALFGINGKYMFFSYNDNDNPKDKKTGLFRYNFETKKSKRVSKELVDIMRSGSKRFIFYDLPGDDAQVKIFIMDRNGSNIKKIAKANGAAIRNNKVYYWCKNNGKYVVYTCGYKGENKKTVARYNSYDELTENYGFLHNGIE